MVVLAEYTTYSSNFYNFIAQSVLTATVSSQPQIRYTQTPLKVESTAGIDNDAASSMMQNFWDYATETPPANDDSETRR
ncbi:hypothetical protein E3N88_32440 [Mikania micrantha]|uniref:Uncharacterized protein n=1 Tax=Mikania micrantha TaxID=192012 RepID=A0A5N6M8J6_9ASTR|nr:hypothetical protein E3N88_32440 [Mikania micrantha]